MTTNWVMDSVQVSVVPGGLDDGAFNAGTEVDFGADTVSISRTVNTEDHSTGQDLVESHRTTKVTWQIDVETKLDSGGALLDALLPSTNQLIGVAVTGGTGTGITISGNGILTDLTINPGAPSTIKFSVKPYGTDLTISTP